VNLATMWTCDECGTVMDESKIVTVYVDHPRPGRDRIAVSWLVGPRDATSAGASE